MGGSVYQGYNSGHGCVFVCVCVCLQLSQLFSVSQMNVRTEMELDGEDHISEWDLVFRVIGSYTEQC